MKAVVEKQMKMKNNILILICSLAMVACGLSPKTLEVGSGNGAAALTSVDIGLPDRTQIGVPNAMTLLTGFHLVITDKSCQRKIVSSDILDYTNTASVNFKLRQGCDYELTLALGQKGAAGATQLASSFYVNNTPEQIPASRIAGQLRLNLTLYLQITPAGTAAGLPAGSNSVMDIASNQLQSFIPTQPGANFNTMPPTNPVGNQSTALAAKFNSLMVTSSASGEQTTSFAPYFKGTYLFAEFSALNCGPCISFAKQIEGDATVKQILNSGNCSLATFVSPRDLSGWISKIGGNAAAHSFGYQGGASGAGTAFGISVTSTPTTAIVDRQGQVIKQGHQELLKDFKSMCGAG